MTNPTDPRIAVLSALSSPDWHPIPEAHGMPWDEAEQLLAAYDASRTAAVVSPAPDRVTTIYDAIDAFQREHRTGGGLQHAQIRGLLAEHLDRVLPAVSAGVAPATDQTAAVEWGAALAADGLQPDVEYAIDIDADGRPFARVLFAFEPNVDGGRRTALVHGITRTVDGAEFGAEKDWSAAPSTDRAALRDRIADTLAAADGWKWAPGFKSQSPAYQGYQDRADAVLAVLPAPTDRAGARIQALRDAETEIASAIAHDTDRDRDGGGDWTPMVNRRTGMYAAEGIVRRMRADAEAGVDSLRRVAGEAQQPETQGFVCKCPPELCRCGHHAAVSQPDGEA